MSRILSRRDSRWSAEALIKVIHTTNASLGSDKARAVVNLTDTKRILNCLLGDPGAEGLAYLINAFDPSLVPLVREEATTRASDILDIWMQSASDLGVILSAINYASSLPSPPPKLPHLKKRYMEMVHDRWDHILQLITCIILFSHLPLYDRTSLVAICSRVLHEIASIAGHDDLIRELFTNPKTIKVAFILLLQRDQGTTGRYIFLGDLLGRKCPVLGLLLYCIANGDQSCPHSFSTHLKTITSSRRNSIVSMITERLSDAISLSAQGTKDSLKTGELASYPLIHVATHALFDTKLTRVFQDANYYSAVGQSLNQISKLATQYPEDDSWANTWDLLYRSSTNILAVMILRIQFPRVKDALLSCLNAGLLQASLRCFVRQGRLEEIEGSFSERFMHLHTLLHSLAAHLIDLQLFRAINLDAITDVLSVLEENEDTKNFSPISNKFKDMFARCALAAERRDSAQWELCQNFESGSCSSAMATPRANPRKCGRCQAVMYCSEECQKLDYGPTHLSECRALRAASMHSSNDGTSPSITPRVLTQRLDQYAWLEHLMNDGMPLVCGAVADRSRPKDTPHHSSDTISLFDFVATHHVSFLSYLLNDHISRYWSKVNGVWDARARAYVKEMQSDPVNLALAECFFPYDVDSALFVLAVMRYDPLGPVGGDIESWQAYHAPGRCLL